MATEDPILVVNRVSKRFGSFTAVDDISFSIRRGEIVSLLGPSGCGKTTTLRLIAGFIHPDAGEIRLASQIINNVPPYLRELGVVFQNYALFPYLTVASNVAFGMRTRRVAKREIAERVAEALSLVRLEKMDDRYPHELSGGQQQRVAIARAIVIRPAMLLLDEPLSGLDALLRAQMQLEMRRIIERANVTAINVTHNQEEALSLSDRVIVMSHGRIEQEGDPLEVYNRPVNEFVATFLGRSNIIRGVVQQRNGDVLVVTTDSGADMRIGGVAAAEGTSLVLQIRPEALTLSDHPATDVNSIGGEVIQSAFLGSTYEYLVRAVGHELLVHVPARQSTKAYVKGDSVSLHWRSEDMAILAAVGNGQPSPRLVPGSS